MSALTWGQYFGIVVAGALLMAGGLTIIQLLRRLNDQLENVRQLLDLSAQRLSKIEGSTHGIARHTERAVKDQYEQDDWDMRNPPDAIRSFPKASRTSS